MSQREPSEENGEKGGKQSTQRLKARETVPVQEQDSVQPGWSAVRQRGRGEEQGQLPLGLVSPVREGGLHPEHNEVTEVFYGSSAVCSSETSVSAAFRSPAKQPLDSFLRGKSPGSFY